MLPTFDLTSREGIVEPVGHVSTWWRHVVAAGQFTDISHVSLLLSGDRVITQVKRQVLNDVCTPGTIYSTMGENKHLNTQLEMMACISTVRSDKSKHAELSICSNVWP